MALQGAEVEKSSLDQVGHFLVLPEVNQAEPISHSQHIEQALRPSQWPPAGPQEPARTPGILSVMRRATAGLNGTQLDLKPLPRSG